MHKNQEKAPRESTAFTHNQLALLCLFFLGSIGFSYFVGGWVLDFAARFLATGDNTIYQDFLKPSVHAILFALPIVLVTQFPL